MEGEGKGWKGEGRCWLQEDISNVAHELTLPAQHSTQMTAPSLRTETDTHVDTQ